jgi:hypothetical protein
MNVYPMAAAVPEPESWAMLAAGFAIVALARRRRTLSAQPTAARSRSPNPD